MLVAAFFGSALIWGFICVLAAIVVGAAFRNPVSWWKRVLVGAVVGALFGFLILYLLVSLVSVVAYLFTLLTPARLDPFALATVTTLLMAGATTLTAIAVGALADRSAVRVREYAMVGAAFGLIVGVTNSVLRLVASTAVIPALEAAGWSPAPGTYWSALLAIQLVADIALAVVAYRLLRRRRVAT